MKFYRSENVSIYEDRLKESNGFITCGGTPARPFCISKTSSVSFYDDLENRHEPRPWGDIRPPGINLSPVMLLRKRIIRSTGGDPKLSGGWNLPGNGRTTRRKHDSTD